jgi:hypothetical protein
MCYQACVLSFRLSHVAESAAQGYGSCPPPGRRPALNPNRTHSRHTHGGAAKLNLALAGRPSRTRSPRRPGHDNTPSSIAGARRVASTAGISRPSIAEVRRARCVAAPD